MILAHLKSSIGWHLVFEGGLVLGIVSEEYIFVDVKDTILNVLLTKSSEQLTIQIISDSTTIQDLTQHVFQD